MIPSGRTKKKLEAVYDEIESAGHPQPVIHPLNLESLTPTDVDTIAEAIDQNFRPARRPAAQRRLAGSLAPIAN